MFSTDPFTKGGHISCSPINSYDHGCMIFLWPKGGTTECPLNTPLLPFRIIKTQLVVAYI